MDAKVSGSKVVVTCDPAFAGKTISCTKSGTTLTQVCPSTSPYTVTFEGLESGTWTISGTVQGQTFTTTAEVQDVSAVLSYGFVWTTWVDTASQLDSTDYNTLDELLEDEEAVRELMLEHACVDYLSSFSNVTPNLEKVIENDICAKWINLCDYALDTCYANAALKAVMDEVDKYGYGEWVIIDNTTTPPTWGPKGNIPVMTSNTAPYGTASASAVYSTSNRQPYYAFDNNGNTTAWSSGNSSNSAYIQYQFTNPVIVKKFKIGSGFGSSISSILKTFELKASNDGFVNDTHSLGSFNGENTANVQEFEVNNSDAYLYYRIVTTSRYNPSDYNWIHTLQFYGRELSVSVPVMSGNTTPYGTVSALTENHGASGREGWKAFDGNDNTGWWGAFQNNTTYVQYDFGKTIQLAKCIGKCGSGSSDSQTFKVIFEYSMDNVNWYAFGDEISKTGTGIFDISTDNGGNTVSARYVRCRTTYSSFGVGVYTPTLQFYGKDYSEKEFEAGTTKKWLYDHGVELEEMTLTNTNANATGVKRDSDVYLKKTDTSNMSAITAQLDLSPYSLCRMKYGKEGDKGAGSRYGCLDVMSSLVYDDNDSFLVATKYITSDMPNNISLDISSINQTRYIGLSVRSSSNVTTYATLNEMWLE